MTHPRSQHMSTSGHGLFVSGIVVGLCVGLAAGHLLLFSRQEIDVEVTSQPKEFPLFLRESADADLELEADLPADVSFSIVEFGDDQDVGRVTLSEIAPAPQEHLQYFPEAMNEPGAEFAGRTDVALATDLVPSPPVQLSAQVSSETDSAPQPLVPAPAAAPIDGQTSEREQRARAIVRDELPEATPQELEVWTEVLQGLPPDDIKGILRMRKNVGPGHSLALSKVLSAPPVETTAPAQLDSRTPAIVSAIAAEEQTLLQIEEHNRANQNTVAYKRLVPLIVEARLDEGSGVRVRGIVRDMLPGQLQQTRRRLDVAIDGSGFLQVRRGEDVRYTRDGRLSIDPEGQLRMQATLEPWLLDPPVVVPPEATQITISEDGTVTARFTEETSEELGQIAIVQFIDPTALEADAEGLYAATPTSGIPHPNDADALSGSSLRQGYLEASNVDLRDRPRHAGGADGMTPQ